MIKRTLSSYLKLCINIFLDTRHITNGISDNQTMHHEVPHGASNCIFSFTSTVNREKTATELVSLDVCRLMILISEKDARYS